MSTIRPASANAQFHYPTEGWGLTHDGQRLIMSDGTATLHFLDPQTLQETSRIEVYDDNGPVMRLNELEYINGEIYANIWQTDMIARIAPQTGQVLGWIDLTGLLAARRSPAPVDVLNGIAYDAAGDRLFVTGKLWPKLFEIQLVPVAKCSINRIRQRADRLATARRPHCRPEDRVIQVPAGVIAHSGANSLWHIANVVQQIHDISALQVGVIRSALLKFVTSVAWWRSWCNRIVAVSICGSSAA